MRMRGRSGPRHGTRNLTTAPEPTEMQGMGEKVAVEAESMLRIWSVGPAVEGQGEAVLTEIGSTVAAMQRRRNVQQVGKAAKAQDVLFVLPAFREISMEEISKEHSKTWAASKVATSIVAWLISCLKTRRM